MKVLLTGGTGYIGAHVAVELLESGYHVVIADDYSNSHPEVAGDIEKITGKTPTVYNLDVCDRQGLGRLFDTERPDAVIHLAGFKAVGESVREPLKYYMNNLGSTLSLLDSMQKHSCGKLVFSSSATVYGASDSLPYTESMEPGASSSPYGSTKQMIEKIIVDMAESGLISSVILRYFNPVGAHESGLIGELPQGAPNNLMPYIMQVAVRKLPELSIFGNDYPTKDGTGIRDYIHIVDLARGHVSALIHCMKNDGVNVFNLGTGRGHSVLELIEMYQRVNEVNIPYNIVPRRAGDLPVTYADVSKSKRLMGWSAKLTLEDMCRTAHQFMLRNLGQK